MTAMPQEVLTLADVETRHFPGEGGLRLVGGTAIEAPDVPGLDAEAGFDVKTGPYRIDQKPEALIRGLHEEVLAQRERDGGTYGSLAVVVMDSSSPYANVYRYMEAREFKPWYPEKGPDEFAKEMHEEYAPYEEDSKFILLMDTEKMDEDGLPILVGMARAVGGRPDLLKTVHDMPTVWTEVSEAEILEDIAECDSEYCVRASLDGSVVGDPAGTWDIASLAVAEEYRHTGIYALISHEVYRLAQENNIHTLTTILVENFFDIYQAHRVPFEAIAGVEPREHMRVLSVPAVMHMPEALRLRDSADEVDQLVWQMFALGKGFDHFRATV